MSERRDVAVKIAEWIMEKELAHPYGGDVVQHDGKGRPYVVAFSEPGNLDGVVSVYSPSYISVAWTTRYGVVSREGHKVFLSLDDTVEFLKTAFIDLDSEKVAMCMDKAKK